MKNFQIILGLIVFGLHFSTPLIAQSTISRERTVQKINDHIFIVIHKDSPDGYPQGNTTVIIGNDAVLVVDACYLQSSANEDIQEIKKWTDKPVKYLVNTHWHPDHVMGNSVYTKAYPGLNIIAHNETRKNIEGYIPGFLERFPKRAEQFQKILDSGKDPFGKPLSGQDRKEYQEALKGLEPVWDEFKDLVPVAPNMSFSDQMFIDLGDLEVELKYFGKATTAGDIVIYLPEYSVTVMGDMMSSPVPYLDGYPTDYIKTLKQISLLKTDTFISGHGNVLNKEEGLRYLQNVIDFENEIVSQVSEAIYVTGSGTRNLEKVRQIVDNRIDVEKWRKVFAGDRPENISFFNTYSYHQAVTSAYNELCVR